MSDSKTKGPYTVHNIAGGQEARYRNLERAVLHALDECPLGPGYVLDRDDKRVDLSAWEKKIDEDGNACLVDAADVAYSHCTVCAATFPADGSAMCGRCVDRRAAATRGAK